MPYFEFFWTDEILEWTDEILEHLAEHGVGADDFEHVVSQPERVSISRSSGRPCCWGETADGRQLFCVYEQLDDDTIIPITASEVAAPGD